MKSAFQIIAGEISERAEGLLDDEGVDEKAVNHLAKSIVCELAKNGIIRAKKHKIVKKESKPLVKEPFVISRGSF